MIKNHVKNDNETVQVIIIFRLKKPEKCFYLVKQKQNPSLFQERNFWAKRGSSINQSTNLKLGHQ